MADVDDLFNCFDEEVEDKQTTVPIVLDLEPNNDESVE